MTDRLIIDGRNEQKPQPKTEKPYRGCEICEQKMRADERAKMFSALEKILENSNFITASDIQKLKKVAK